MAKNDDLLFNLRGFLEIAFTLPMAPILRQRYNHWGAAPDEIAAEYPGDRFAPQPVLAYTRAITIAAPPASVWPWITQIGQGRGGLYSYDRIENIIRCDIHSADRILTDLPPFHKGDKMRLGPEGYPFFYVLAVEPQKYLLLGNGSELKTSDDARTADLNTPPPAGGDHNTWLFFLKPLPGEQTRLIVRARNQYTRTRAADLTWHITEPLNFVMEKAMLRGLKSRAEHPTAS